MKISKKIIISFILFIALSSFSYAEIIYSNLSIQEKTDILNQRMKKSQTNPDEVPMTITSEGLFNNQTVKASLILTQDIKGDIVMENTYIGADLIVASSTLKKLTMRNSVVNGNIYVISSSNNMPMNIINSKLKNIYIANPVNINETGAKSEIYNIITTEHLKKGSKMKINAYVQKLVNNAEGITIEFNGKMNILSANKKFNLIGANTYKTKMTNDNSFDKKIFYDLSNLNTNFGYNNIADDSTFAGLYDVLKKEQYKNSAKISIIVKNPTDANLKNANNAVDLISKFIPNNSTGFYATSFTDKQEAYGIYNIYFLYDTGIQKIRQSEQIINDIYENIKKFDDFEYVKQLNKILALRTVYDETLTRHSLYDAAVLCNSVCEGYTKIGYELLAKKFGTHNTITIANNDHIWNMLKLNGKWYHIDFTHNDPVTKPLDKNNYIEDFLLVSDTDLKKLDKKRTWNMNVYPRANETYKK